MVKKSLVIFGCRNNTLDFINALNKSKFKIDLIVSISPSVAKKNKVSGYFNLKNIKNIKAKVVFSDKYNLKNNLRYFFEKKNYDIGISIGWQRIIPDEILNSFNKGIYGMHCSYVPLPSGKGRSPIIWTIIKGYNHMYVQIFKYVNEFDSGPLIFRKKLKIFKYEDIDVLQKKLSIIFSSFVNKFNFDKIEYLKRKKINSIISFPKRNQNSGLIILKKHNAKSFCNFVRAQTYPYPCAFIAYKNIKFKILEAQIFKDDKQIYIDKDLKFHIFYDRTFIFRLKKDYVYVKKHNINKKYLKHEIFNKIFI